MYKIFCPCHKQIDLSRVRLRQGVKDALDRMDNGSQRPNTYQIFCPIRGCRKVSQVTFLAPNWGFFHAFNAIKGSEGLAFKAGQLCSISTDKVIESMKNGANTNAT